MCEVSTLSQKMQPASPERGWGRTVWHLRLLWHKERPTPPKAVRPMDQDVAMAGEFKTSRMSPQGL